MTLFKVPSGQPAGTPSPGLCSEHTAFVCLTIDFCGVLNIMQDFFLPLLTSCDCADSTFYRRINFPLEAVPRMCESLGQFLIEIRWCSISSQFGDRLPPSETFQLRSQPTNSLWQSLQRLPDKGEVSLRRGCPSILGLFSARFGGSLKFFLVIQDCFVLKTYPQGVLFPVPIKIPLGVKAVVTHAREPHLFPLISPAYCVMVFLSSASAESSVLSATGSLLTTLSVEAECLSLEGPEICRWRFPRSLHGKS